MILTMMTRSLLRKRCVLLSPLRYILQNDVSDNIWAWPSLPSDKTLHIHVNAKVSRFFNTRRRVVHHLRYLIWFEWKQAFELYARNILCWMIYRLHSKATNLISPQMIRGHWKLKSNAHPHRSTRNDIIELDMYNNIISYRLKFKEFVIIWCLYTNTATSHRRITVRVLRAYSRVILRVVDVISGRSGNIQGDFLDVLNPCFGRKNALIWNFFSYHLN